MSDDKTEDQWATIDADNASLLASAPEAMRADVRNVIASLTTVARDIEEAITETTKRCTCGKHHARCTPDDAMVIASALFGLINVLGARVTGKTLAGAVQDARKAVAREAKKTKRKPSKGTLRGRR